VAPAVAATFVAEALQRGAAIGKTALHEFGTALRDRAADWKSTYAGLAGRIVSLVRKRSPSALESEAQYARSAEPGDGPKYDAQLIRP
jgi:hypothetical protein